jgi:hypothetical protein
MELLAVGARLTVLEIDLSKIVGSDWMNERAPSQGDVVLIESLSDSTGERIVRLLCEPRTGCLEWRVDVYESGVRLGALSNV